MIELIDPETSVLKDSEITLTPGLLKDHKDYLLRLAGLDRYNKTPREELERGLEYVRHLWVGRASAQQGGILLICHLPDIDWWTLDAYKDGDLDNRVGDYSYRSGRLVIDWFFDNYMVNELHTMHRTDNRAATKMCERLGFKQKYINPQFIILAIRRKIWV